MAGGHPGPSSRADTARGLARCGRILRQPSSSQWLGVTVASLLFIQVPGPSLLFMLGRALTVSLRDALISAAGRARLWFARQPRRLDTMSTAGGIMTIGLGASLAATE